MNLKQMMTAAQQPQSLQDENAIDRRAGLPDRERYRERAIRQLRALDSARQ
jgi:hypothetical protein